MDISKQYNSSLPLNNFFGSRHVSHRLPICCYVATCTFHFNTDPYLILIHLSLVSENNSCNNGQVLKVKWLIKIHLARIILRQIDLYGNHVIVCCQIIRHQGMYKNALLLKALFSISEHVSSLLYRLNITTRWKKKGTKLIFFPRRMTGFNSSSPWTWFIPCISESEHYASCKYCTLYSCKM